MKMLEVGDKVHVDKDALDDGGDQVFEVYDEFVTWEKEMLVAMIKRDMIQVADSMGGNIWVLSEYVYPAITASNDMVNHPSHYQGKGGLEALDVIEAFGLDANYNLACVVKYLLRCDKKDDGLQDLQKAAFYLNREIDSREENTR